MTVGGLAPPPGLALLLPPPQATSEDQATREKKMRSGLFMAPPWDLGKENVILIIADGIY
jgi:hypothetical protein